jgi:hypothetical protein
MMTTLDDNGTVCRADRVQPLVGELDSIAAQAGFTYALTKRQVGLSAECLGRTFDVDSNELKITGEALSAHSCSFDGKCGGGPRSGPNRRSQRRDSRAGAAHRQRLCLLRPIRRGSGRMGRHN